MENVMKFGSGFQDSVNSNQGSLFGADSGAKLPPPVIPISEEWGNIYALNKEKEVVGIYISGHPLDDFKMEIEAFCNGSVSMLNNIEENKGKDLLIAGVISEGEHRTTRRGDPFGTIQLEDYNDSTKLFLWREDYLKYKHFLNPGTFVSVKGRIDMSKWNKLEFNIHSIDLLHNLKETRANAIHLKIATSELDQRMITDLNSLFSENEGSCALHFTIYDSLDGVEVRMPSKTIKVDLTKELFNGLKELNLDFKIK